MNLSHLSELPSIPETTEETPEIPALPQAELRRRLLCGAERLVADPTSVVAAWLAPLSPSSAVGVA